jgi:hypothetical protein
VVWSVASIRFQVAPSVSSATMHSPPVIRPRTRSVAAVRARSPQSVAKSRKNQTPLAAPFAGLTFADRDKFKCEDDCDGRAANVEDRGPFSVAVAFKLIDDTGEEHEIALPDTIEHLRLLCKNLGLRNTGSWSKFMCRRQIALQIDNADIAESSNAKRNETRTNTNCRIVNAAFHPDMMEKLRCLNDAKKRSDHEGKTTFKDFWMEVLEVVNDFDDTMNPGMECIVGTETDAHLVQLEDDVDLTEFNLSTSKSCQQVFFALRKVRAKMKENMTQSGTHGNDPWDFVAVALRAVKQSIGFNEAYYYYTRMEAHPDVEAQFQPFIDESLKGDSFENMSVRQDIKEADKSSAISDGVASLAVTNAAMMTTLEARNSIGEKNAAMTMYFQCVEALKDATLPPERKVFMQLVCDNFEAGK